MLDAGALTKALEDAVTSDTPGYTAKIEAGQSASGPFRPVSGSRRWSTAAPIFKLHGGAARYYVVWITDLGSNGSVHVNEVTAKSG